MSPKRIHGAVLPEPSRPSRPDPEGRRVCAIETGRTRLLVTSVVFILAFGVIGARLIQLSAFSGSEGPRLARAVTDKVAPVGRADIHDRNGVVLVTSLPAASLFADPMMIMDAVEATDKLVSVFPDMDRAIILAKLRSKARFVWIRRNLTPNQQYAINRLGIPGFAFQRTERRVYPFGRMLSHVLGLTDVDGNGVSGLESEFDAELSGGPAPLTLSIDVRLQAMLESELGQAVRDFKAIGGSAMVMDSRTGELLALSSLPDFDPNRPETARGGAAFNRATKGVYELGSTFKLFTAAMALDSGAAKMSTRYDASQPIQVARFTIDDYHGQKRWLTFPEVLIYSSNIGAAKMALDVGTKGQRDYLRRFGLLDASPVELPEIGKPLYPTPWRDINTMTISYGHGIAISPLQLTAGIAGLVNGGVLNATTLLKKNGKVDGTRIISKEASMKMRSLMRLVVTEGTGKNGDAPGYLVGGKTGTADKQQGGEYTEQALISSFVGVFPINDPRYVLYVVLDEPKGNVKTAGYATGGWVAAPSVGRMVMRMAPMMGLFPDVKTSIKPKPKPGRGLFTPVATRARSEVGYDDPRTR